MADPRLNSVHLGFLARRGDYRRNRQALLEAQGMLTLTAARVQDLLGEGDAWPSLLPVRPEQLLPGTGFVLVDRQGGYVYPLRAGVNTVGRLPSNDVVLEEMCVSRRHCALLMHARGGCELHDLASLNGTRVNGQRVRAPVRLASGDWVQVGRTLFLFASEEDYRDEAENSDHPATLPG
jgi:hypothetical protein